MVIEVYWDIGLRPDYNIITYCSYEDESWNITNDLSHCLSYRV